MVNDKVQASHDMTKADSQVLEERRTEKGFTLRKTNFTLRCTVEINLVMKTSYGVYSVGSTAKQFPNFESIAKF